jgi:DNA-binding NarL/FixJ family response regulator
VGIVIAEDAALFRHGLTLLLQDGGHDIVATAADADSARLAVAAQRTELVVLDVRMPPRHDDDGAHRRVLAVLAFLQARGGDVRTHTF